MKEFKSFYKTVGGNEGSKCYYPTRLDTYGCGCQHDCDYCYAKSLLDFRNLWDAKEPAVANVEKIRRKVAKIPRGTVVRLGGMTDCFQPIELKHRVTYETIKALNAAGIEYLIVTKSAIVANPEYLEILDKDLAHVQVTLTFTNDWYYEKLGIEKASKPSDRIKAIEALQARGVDVSIRLSPYIPQLIDCATIKAIKCDKIVLEFLRINTWIKKWFTDKTGYTLEEYSVKSGNYRHLPLWTKVLYVRQIQEYTGKTVTVCEDDTEAYDYFKRHINPNPNDCCNLRRRT